MHLEPIKAESEEYSSNGPGDAIYVVSSGTAVQKDAAGEEDGRRVHEQDADLIRLYLRICFSV